MLDRHVSQIGLAEESINDDSNEQVEEDLRDNDLEEQVESDGNARSAPLWSLPVCWVSSIGNNSRILFFLNTLVENRSGLRGVEHDCVPGFSSGTSDQGQEGGTETLEVHMSVHFAGISNSNEGELRHSNDGKHEDQQHEKETKGSHSRSGIDQSFEYLLQLLLLLD